MDINLKKILKEHYSKILDSNMKVSILNDRASGNTLAKVGDSYSISRERVRQIEKKSTVLLNNLFSYYHDNIIDKYFDENNVFNEYKFKREIGYLEITKHILKMSDHDIKYSKELDKIYYDNDRLEDIIKEIVSHKTLTVEESMKKYLTAVSSSPSTKYMLSSISLDDFMDKLGFIKYDDVYSKNKLTLGEAILILMDKYFPNGLDISHTVINKEKVYNDQLLEFEKLLVRDYHINSKSRKSLVFRIESVCIMYDNAKFIHPSKLYIDPFVMQKILDYINKSNTIYFSNLYEIFKGDFGSSKGITDGYKLHGAITKYFRTVGSDKVDDYVIRRGKISYKKK